MMHSGGIHTSYMAWFRKIEICPFSLKIWKFALRPMATLKSHNSGTVKDTCKMFARNWGVSGSGNQTVLFKFLLDSPLLPRQQVDVILDTKLAITQLEYEISQRFLHQMGDFRGLPSYLCKRKLCQTDPCCHGNENLDISTQNSA